MGGSHTLLKVSAPQYKNYELNWGHIILQAQNQNYGLSFTKLCTESCSQMKYVIHFKIIAGIDFIFPHCKSRPSQFELHIP
jgi:hypothetical protein